MLGWNTSIVTACWVLYWTRDVIKQIETERKTDLWVERDLKEIPDNVKADLDIRPVKWMDDVLEIALERLPEPLEETADAAPEEKSEGRSEVSGAKGEIPINPH